LIDAEILREANQIRTVADGDAVAASIERERANGTIEERRANELLTFTILRTAELLCAAPARDWRTAIEYLEDAIERFGANRELEQTLRNYRTNLAADFHNRFAAEWNRRNYEEAERILNEGLAEFPNDRRLLANRDIVNRSRQN
jgi:tetratricopeptide (TPR) repeat protein